MESNPNPLSGTTSSMALAQLSLAGCAQAAAVQSSDKQAHNNPQTTFFCVLVFFLKALYSGFYLITIAEFLAKLPITKKSNQWL
jgi:hypothetical protein